MSTNDQGSGVLSTIGSYLPEMPDLKAYLPDTSAQMQYVHESVDAVKKEVINFACCTAKSYGNILDQVVSGYSGKPKPANHHNEWYGKSRV